jgi:hypothetical protein
MKTKKELADEIWELSFDEKLGWDGWLAVVNRQCFGTGIQTFMTEGMKARRTKEGLVELLNDLKEAAQK